MADRSFLLVRTGGQTGVDRAALDAAMSLGVAVGGWCPAGRRAEDGVIPPIYPLRETETAEYARRTILNVREAEGLLVLASAPVTGGTALAVRTARAEGKPIYVADPIDHSPVRVAEWVLRGGITDLNVAGPRESEAPGIYDAARSFMVIVIGEILTRSARV